MAETKAERKKRLRRERRKERRQQKKIAGVRKVRSSRICNYCGENPGKKYVYPFIDPEEDEVLDPWLGGLACSECLPVQLEKLHKRNLLEAAEPTTVDVDWDEIAKEAAKDVEDKKTRRRGGPKKPVGPNLTGTIRDIVRDKGPITIEDIGKILHRRKAFKNVPMKKIQRALYRLSKKRKEVAKNLEGEWRYVGK